MQIQTYTNVWATPKRLYAIQDISLPTPVSLTSAVIFLATAAPWSLLLYTLGLRPTSPFVALLYVAVPGVLAWVGNKPIFQGKSIFQYLVGMGRYFSQPRVWTSMCDNRKPQQEKVQAVAHVWIPDEKTEEVTREHVEA